MYEGIREFVKPYEKRGYLSIKQNVRTNGWIAWFSARIEKMVNDDDKNMDMVIQVVVYGGYNSMFHVNGKPEQAE